MKQIPNLITLSNLFLGTVSIVFSFQEELSIAAMLIFVAAVFDFLDGFAARLLKAYSDIGKELDSLADLVSFGLAPAVILHQLMVSNIPPMAFLAFIGNEPDFWTNVGWYAMLLFPFMLTLFSAYRLARFNVDTRQTESFIGLPTPASGLLIASFPLILASANCPDWLQELLVSSSFILPFVAIISYLLVSPLPLMSLKFKSLRWKENAWRFILMAFSLISVIIFKWMAVPIIWLGYIVISLLNVTFAKE